MDDTGAYLCGELSCWPDKTAMASILREAGLNIHVGRYSIRVEDCDNFAFQAYGGDLGDPQIEADADTEENMLRDAKQVSDVLGNAYLRH